MIDNPTPWLILITAGVTALFVVTIKLVLQMSTFSEKLARLRQAIADERAQVLAKLDELSTQVADYKEKVEAGGISAEEEAVALNDIEAIIGEVKGIIPDEVDPVDEEPVEGEDPIEDPIDPETPVEGEDPLDPEEPVGGV